MLVRKKYSLELSIIYINHIFCNPCGDLLKLDTLMMESVESPQTTIHMKKITDEYDLHLPAKNKGIQYLLSLATILICVGEWQGNSPLAEQKYARLYACFSLPKEDCTVILEPHIDLLPLSNISCSSCHSNSTARPFYTAWFAPESGYAREKKKDIPAQFL
jgi:hypothetical protein